MAQKLLAGVTNVIDGISVELKGVPDFDNWIWNCVSLGKISTAQASLMRKYTDGYKVSLTSKWATGFTYTNSKKYMNCLFPSIQTVTNVNYGAYCVYANTPAAAA